MTTKKITTWYKWNKDTLNYEFNHIENGHVEGFIPTINFKSQKCWLNNSWIKKYAFLSNNIIMGE